ncbi:MAG: ribbon-helix-helix protein, CopG family [Pseudomonadota bacterium]
MTDFKIINLKIPPELYEKINRLAQESNRSKTDMLRQLVEEGISYRDLGADEHLVQRLLEMVARRVTSDADIIAGQPLQVKKGR